MARGILLNPRCFSHNSTPNFYIRPVVPDPNKNENREKKEGKDVANIETRRTQKRFFPMSVLLPSVSHPCHKSYYKLFARFPLRPACCLAPSQRSSPQAISTVLLCPACCLAPSQRSSPQTFPTHFPSAAVRAAKLADLQRLLLPTHFQLLPCTHAVRSRPRSSPHPFAVRSRPRSQGRSSPAASSPHPFPTTPLHPRRPQPSTQFSAPICCPQPSAQPSSLTSGFFSPPISSHPLAPTPSAAVHAVLRTHLPSAAVRAAKVAHHQRLLLPTHFQPPPCTHAVRSRPRSSPHPFPATPLHPRRPQPHPFAAAAVRAAKLAHHQRLLLPTHFQPLRCTHAVRSHPRSSPHPFPVRSRPRSQARSSPAASSPHPFPTSPLHPRRPQPSAQFSAPICRPQPSAQPRSLITSGFFSPPISSHSVAPTPSAAVHAVLRTHLLSAAVRAAKVAHHQRLLLPTHFQPLRCTHAVRSRPRSSPHPFAVRSRPRSQGRSSPAASSPHPFPATPLHPRRPQPSAQFSAPICRPQPTHAVRSRPRSSPHPFAVRSRPRSQGRSSPAASSPHPFPATPLHPRRPQPSTQFSAPICRPQPSAQPRSLITSGFFSPLISSHPLAPTPSAAVHAVLRTHLLSAAVRAAKLAHHQRLLLPTHFQPLRCTHAVRSRPRSSPHPFAVRSRPRSQGRSSPAASSLHPFPATPLHPRRPQPSAQFSAPICRPQPSAQPRSLITSGFFSPPISSHSVAPTPSAAVHAVLRTHFPSAAVRAATLAHHQRLLLPIHFQPRRCTRAIHNRPRTSPHPFPVRSRPRSQARSSPAASSPHPFPATPLHPGRPQPSAPFLSLPFPSFPILSLPFPSFPFLSLPFRSLFLPFPSFPFLSLPVPSFPFLSLPFPSFPFLSLFPTHFQPLRCTHAVRSHPRSSPHPFAVRSRPRSQGRSSPAASSPHPFPATPLHPRRPQPSAQFSAPICRPQPSAQPRSLITSGFFSPPISSHSVAPTPSAAVHAVLRTHLPSAAVRAAKVAHHQRLLLPTHFQPLRCTHAVRSHPRSSPHPFAVRSRPRSQGRSSLAASSPHPFPATPLHPRRPQPSA